MAFLEPEIKAGLVQVLQDPQSVTVRLTNRNMFGSGEANLAASYMPLLGRIGDALDAEPGNVLVYGYTDDQPIRHSPLPIQFRAVAGPRRRRRSLLCAPEGSQGACEPRAKDMPTRSHPTRRRKVDSRTVAPRSCSCAPRM